jgi:osmotically-inducible protein OsmY
VVTLSGEVDRKSDAQLLTRLTKEVDGVVGVIDRLSYRSDDTGAPASLERIYRAV